MTAFVRNFYPVDKIMWSKVQKTEEKKKQHY